MQAVVPNIRKIYYTIIHLFYVRGPSIHTFMHLCYLPTGKW